MFAGFAVLLSTGCVGFWPIPSGATTFGHTSGGVLIDGASLDDSGTGFVRARPGEPTRYGTERLVAALVRAAGVVDRDFAGTAPLRIGDLSAPQGGRHSRHGSHRSGRDADVVFFLVDDLGRSVRGRSWLAFDRFGAARETDAPGDRAASRDLYFFDTARNWHFVRTLLADDEAHVQWIFCSRGIKARLLEYGARVERDPDILVRAAWVLHQPSSGNPHADHFHVRIACSAHERALGCVERGPIWPWLRSDLEKPELAPGDPMTDDALVAALLEDTTEEEVVASGGARVTP